MGVLGDGASWCFCSGGGKSERTKGGIFSAKGSAMATVSGGGAGFLIHRSLLLSTHANLPSTAAAEAAEVWIHHGRVPARLVPQRFFITSNILDLTIVGLDILETKLNSEVQQPCYLKTSSNPNLELGSTVYILGHTDKKELKVGEGKLVVATDSLLKLSTDGVTWCPGSAGFDVNGSLAFMICDPMKRASSPTTKSSSTSSSSALSWKKELPMQFGIPIPVICDWLYQHWEGNLDELSKPKLPLRRFISTGQRSDHSCASFNMRSVFKPAEQENEDTSSSSQVISRLRYHSEEICSVNENICPGGDLPPDLQSIQGQGIRTPEIYASPSLTSGPIQRKEHHQIHLLDINFPPKAPKSILLPLPLRQLLPDSDENKSDDVSSREDGASLKMEPVHPHREIQIRTPCSSQGDCCSEVQSCSSPLEASKLRKERDGFSSEEETMYSAETMESRNYPSPRQNKNEVRRSQSCVNYNRWGSNQRNPSASKISQQKQNSSNPARRTRSQAAPLSQRSHEYYSPTVSSIMKKRNSSEPRARTRPTMILLGFDCDYVNGSGWDPFNM